MLLNAPVLRHWQGVGRQEGARSTRDVFAGDSFQPWLSGSRRGLAGSVEGHVVGEVGVSRRFWYQCTGTRARELEDRTSC